MLLSSTNGLAPDVSFREALVRGIAPDGGLYRPLALPRLDAADLDTWRGRPFPDVASRLARMWLRDEWPDEAIDRLVRGALDFPVPTVAIDASLAMLELFHGPTLAFKDFGARFLARFLGDELAARGEHVTILVATSGDTGSAVARGFAGVDGISVVVLYPAGRVSPFQESQMATIGGNITAVRVPGTFDDCQRLVKTAFLDSALAGLRLSSANSISIGRLLPQSFYYVFSWLSATERPGEPVVFCVPSGNLGNLTAGVLAAEMGLPVARFIAATNANDVLPEYLTTGVYRPRPALATISNAMDVGDPSNFARLSAIFGGKPDSMRGAIAGLAVSDADTRAEIRETYAASGRVLDPHGAVACRAARRWSAAQPAGRPRVIALGTAHPAKFAGTIEEELGFEPALPPHEHDWQFRPLLAIDLPDASSGALTDLLLSRPRVSAPPPPRLR
jgi:threonine synthase